MHEEGVKAASLTTAQAYISAFGKLASTNNTLILPANVADVSGLVGSAVTAYKTLNNTLDSMETKVPEELQVEAPKDQD